MINVLCYLEQTLERISDRNKTAFHGTGGETLSFSELSNLSRACGSYLLDKNITGKPVVVFMKKSPSMIAAFFGCIYAGNYYIPIDAEMPAFRIKLILEAVNPALIICDNAECLACEAMGTGVVSQFAKRLACETMGTGVVSYPYVLFDDICRHAINDSALSDVRRKAIDTDPLYVVFTSGSTGIPKGVVATHRSVIDYIENLSVVLGVTEDTVFGNQSPLYLDACLKEVYTTIKFGCSAYLIPQSLFMFPVKLIEYINDNGINTICWVASALSLVAGLGALKSAVPNSLHTIAFGSEVFPVRYYNMWRELLPHTRFIHLYGPTEATGMSCFYEVTKTYREDEFIPIGHPFPNTCILLIDDNGSVPADGEPGEICIRGTCLSPGYFGDKEKTANTFVQNPLSAFPDLIYKTGDLGRRGPDGELYYISRRDHQIKHMGHRIELAEIEYVANNCDGVGLACAVFDDTDSKIVLYYMPEVSRGTGEPVPIVSQARHWKNASVFSANIKPYLKANLPRYMLPQSIIELDEMPQTPGGKIDRTGLLERYREGRNK